MSTLVSWERKADVDSTIIELPIDYAYMTSSRGPVSIDDFILINQPSTIPHNKHRSFGHNHSMSSSDAKSFQLTLRRPAQMLDFISFQAIIMVLHQYWIELIPGLISHYLTARII